jgi:branched-chain amino acid transport system permease protein
VYHLQLGATLGGELRYLGVVLDVTSAQSWFGSVFVMLTGAGLFEVARRHFRAHWNEIQVDIEKEIKRRELAA